MLYLSGICAIIIGSMILYLPTVRSVPTYYGTATYNENPAVQGFGGVGFQKLKNAWLKNEICRRTRCGAEAAEKQLYVCCAYRRIRGSSI